MTVADPHSAPNVTAIVVNYRTADLVLSALEGLAAQCAAAGRAEIVIVDNMSPTDDAAVLKGALSRRAFACPVRLIESPANGGFGAGNNIALRESLAAEAPPDFILFVNPDARLRAGALSALLAAMETHPRCAFAGPAIFNADGDPAAAAFRRFSILGEFEQAARLGPVSALLRGVRVPLPPQTGETRADWVSGAVFLARASALRQTGLFDETYFLYFEETDLMLRARRLGWEVWHVPGAEAEHLEGRSDPQQNAEDRVLHPSDHWYRSRAHYFRKAHGPVYASLADGARIAGALLDLARSSLSGRRDENRWPEIRKFIRRDYARRGP